MGRAYLTSYPLTSSGNASPAVTISANTNNSLDQPAGVALDAAGDLWVANSANNTVVEYTLSQLAASGSPTPTVTISDNTNSTLFSPGGLAFDAAGDLWVAGYGAGGTGNNTLDGYTPSQLSTTGDPTPADSITGGNTKLEGPAGLAIAQAPTVTAVSPTSGTASGGTTVTIHGNGFYPGSTVDFGSSPASSVTYQGPYELTAVSPAGSGTVDVTVSTFAGTSATSSADQFSYQAVGYTMVGSDGGVFSFGAPFEGSLPGLGVSVSDIVGIVPTADHQGYWMVGSDGGVFAFGDAGFLGSLPGLGVHASDIRAFVPTPDGKGYRMVGSDGGVFAFGDAVYQGSLPALGVSVSDIVGLARG